jgi:hypothetical protein
VPFLRVVRDKRGYETTYLIHASRENAQQTSRVIYAFRSPGGVRVGRDAFEPSVRREIEASNPGITFDWDGLLSGQHIIDANPELRRPRRRIPSPGAQESGRAAQGSQRTAHDSSPSRASLGRRPQPMPQVPRLSVPVSIDGDTPETRMRFLAHWHGILCEQLPEKISDPIRREALMTLAQRLNPAGWIDADEIAVGIQQAGEALEQLSRVLSRRRRKPRRGSREVADGARTETGAGDDDAGDGTEEGLASSEMPAGDQQPTDQPVDHPADHAADQTADQTTDQTTDQAADDERDPA